MDGPIGEDKDSQVEDGSNKDEDNNEDNDSEQEHTKDNAPTASATSVDTGMFVFFHDVFSISYFTLLLGSLGM